MEGKMVHLRIPAKLYAVCAQIVKDNGFGSIQELARESLRKTAGDYETGAAIKRLRKLQGSVKNIKRLTEKERKGLYQQYLKQTDEEKLQLLREFGLDKVRKI